MLGAEPTWSLVLVVSGAQIPALLPLDAVMLDYHLLVRSVPTTLTPFLLLIFSTWMSHVTLYVLCPKWSPSQPTKQTKTTLALLSLALLMSPTFTLYFPKAPNFTNLYILSPHFLSPSVLYHSLSILPDLDSVKPSSVSLPYPLPTK